MKKGIIGIIIIAALGCCACTYYFSSSSSNKVVTSQTSSLGTNSSNQSTKSVTLKSKPMNNGNDTTATSSNQSESSNIAQSQNTSTSANATTNTSQQSNQVDWQALNSSAVLTQSQQKTLIAQLTNAIYKDGQNTQNVENYLSSILIPAIKNKLTGANLDRFNQIVGNFYNYILVEAQALVTGRHESVQNNQSVHEMDLGNMYINFAIYLISAYSNPSYSPLLSDRMQQLYNQISTGMEGPKLATGLDNAINSVNDAVNQMNPNDSTNVLDTFNSSYEIMNDNLNNNYNYIKDNLDKILVPQVLINSEVDWISFKNQQINVAGEGFTGITKQIAQQREAVRMTEARNFVLNYYISENMNP